MTRSGKVLRVCWIKDQKPGHLTKVRGLLKAIGQHRSIDLTECEVNWVTKSVRLCLRYLPFLKSKYPLRYCLDLPHSLDSFDLVVSAGGATEWPNARLGQLSGAKNIYLGSLRMFDCSAFSLLPRIDEGNGDNVVKMTIVPSELNRSQAALEAHRVFPKDFGKTWTVLIGGDGSGIAWTISDWLALAKGIIGSAREARARLIVTTSRRTGRVGEKTLKAEFEASGLLACGVWHCEGPSDKSPSLVAMIGQSELVCVTEDSASMVNEAVASGRPVFTFRPERSQLSDLIESMLCRLEEACYIHRNKHLVSLEIAMTAKEWTLMDDDWHYFFGKQILKLLNMAKEEECI